MLSRRYLAMWCAVLLLIAAAALASIHVLSWLWIILPVALVALGLYDLNQDRHAILRNYPLWATSASCSNSSDLKSASTSSRTTPTRNRSRVRSAASSTSARRTSPTTARTAPS